ncbi:PEP-CTERM sorting domain-containing protein [Nitrosovibrio sp. Nv4]|uniref:PEP-CTERM sorting domain-containing protein n=1 Tax=Nitrosovibrio sp. Nv4 TaxID=1945880 RepID=UPI000BD96998|nr:PEP-CTERM sorting domain-containing protein [Nitrosovibrio sp. Nv4]SOD41954.1 PEP-CTERM protein-sorting domain-containing protein [Nitrosovibrio sp. Nv4]
MTKKINLLIAGVLSSIASVSAYAAPVAAPGTEGLPIFASATDPVVATYQGNSDGTVYSNDLYLMLNASGQAGNDGDLSNDLLLFNSLASSVGETKSLGPFASGTDLMFRLHVTNTGHDFFTGPASSNPDGQFHARVEQNWLPNTTLISFEDLHDTVGNSSVFNDLSFSLTNTTTIAAAVPEPEAYAMMLAGLGLVSVVIRRRKKA